VECFVLIRHIIGGVDYKGVREIMKVGSPLIVVMIYFVFLICIESIMVLLISLLYNI